MRCGYNSSEKAIDSHRARGDTKSTKIINENEPQVLGEKPSVSML